MCLFYSVFLRTAESTARIESILAAIINSPLQKNPRGEDFFGKFLGINIWIDWLDDDLNQTVVQFNDEYITLSAYDRELKIYYDEHFFIRDHEESWSQAVATVLADALCRALSCEALAVRNYETAFARYMPFEERVIDE